MKKTLLIFGPPSVGEDQRPLPGTAPTLLNLRVNDAEMVTPGWLRFTIANTDLPDYDVPATVCWQQIPDGGSAELQHRVDDEDVARRAKERDALGEEMGGK